jgi:bacillithiol biosynthesis cysteine-adding enzyme BshC
MQNTTVDKSTMEIIKIDAHEVPFFSEKDKAYMSGDERYAAFFEHPPQIESFANVIKLKAHQNIDRQLLVDQIREIYSKRQISAQQESNISHLKDELTFTITTAHQPSLFTGPLYYIYKICSALKLVAQCNMHYPEYRFVPIFISGGEDHDFEEVNHCNIFNKRIEWNENAGGAVGRMPIDKLDDVIEEFSSILGDSENAVKIKEILYTAYNNSRIYKDFSFNLVNELFEKYGLIVLDMDRKAFKKAFSPIVAEELTHRPSESIVLNTQEQLNALGISSQAHPRDVNLFYLKDNYRVRITFENGMYQLVDTDISFTQEEILEELKNHPERFSPNVIMRPLYQEVILPNLAYIGGGGEIAYWLERKDQFKHFGIPFPMLVRRDSALILDSSAQKQLAKHHLKLADLFPPIDFVINNYLSKNTDVSIDLSSHKSSLETIFNEISEDAGTIDPTIKKWILAEKTKQVKVFDQIESRLKRTLKQQEETKINQITKLREKLFPGNGLQERHDNFFQYALNDGLELIDALIENFDPLSCDFKIFKL